MSTSDQEILSDLHDKEYAHEYMDEFLNQSIATQIKVLREQNEWTQEQLAEEAGMFQERISVLENVNNSSWNLKTLKKLAKAFDVRLHVSFENFTTELEHLRNFTFESIIFKKSLERVPREKDIALAESRLKHMEPVRETLSLDDFATQKSQQKSDDIPQRKRGEVIDMSQWRNDKAPSQGHAESLKPLPCYG